MIPFVYIFVSVIHLSYPVFSVCSVTERTLLSSDINLWNKSSTVLPDINVKILHDKNLPQAHINQNSKKLSYSIGKRSLPSKYRRNRSYHPLHRKKKYALFSQYPTKLIPYGKETINQYMNSQSNNYHPFRNENLVNQELNNRTEKYNLPSMYQENQTKANSKTISDQLDARVMKSKGNFLPIIKRVKKGFSKPSKKKLVNQEFHSDIKDRPRRERQNRALEQGIFFPNTNKNSVNKLPHENSYKERSVQNFQLNGNGRIHEHPIVPQKKSKKDIPNLNGDSLHPATDVKELDTSLNKIFPIDEGPKSEIDLSNAIFSKELINSPDYEKALVLRKTKRIEMLIKDRSTLMKLVKNSKLVDPDIYPALKSLEEELFRFTTESNAFSEAKVNIKYQNNKQSSFQPNLKNFQSLNDTYSNAQSLEELFNDDKYSNEPGSQELYEYSKTSVYPNYDSQYEDSVKVSNFARNGTADSNFAPNEGNNNIGFSSDLQFQAPKDEGTKVGQEHKNDAFTDRFSHPYIAEVGTGIYDVGFPGQFQAGMNVGQAQQISWQETASFPYLKNSNVANADNFDGVSADYYGIPVDKSQVSSNSGIQSDVKTGQIEMTPNSLGSQLIPYMQNMDSEPDRGINMPPADWKPPGGLSQQTDSEINKGNNVPPADKKPPDGQYDLSPQDTDLGPNTGIQMHPADEQLVLFPQPIDLEPNQSVDMPPEEEGPPGRQPVLFPQHTDSESNSGVNTPSPTNLNGYKIVENLTEKKIDISNEITKSVIKKPETFDNQYQPSSLQNNGVADGRSNVQESNVQHAKTFFSKDGTLPKQPSPSLTTSIETLVQFGNLTELEALAINNNNVSNSFLIREETEYVSARPSGEKTVTLADYYAKNPPVENLQEEEDRKVDPRMLRMHVRPFKKKHEGKLRGRRFGTHFPPFRVMDAPKMTAEFRPKRRKRRQINAPEESCCYNGGTCISIDEHRVKCLCGPGYTGQLCEMPKNRCQKAGEVCKEHEVCTNLKGKFSCTCAPNFVREGDDCIPAVTCEEFPCLNGAECEDTDDGKFRCHCRLGYMGKTCSTRVPECEDSSCSNEEICISTETGYECVKKIKPFNKF